MVSEPRADPEGSMVQGDPQISMVQGDPEDSMVQGDPRISMAAEDSPVPADPDGPGAPARAVSRAGRNLAAAIAVGAVLGCSVIAILLLYRQGFVLVVALAVIVSLWELIRAMDAREVRLPIVPLLLGSLAMIALAYQQGSAGLVVCFMLTALGCLVWRLADGAGGYLRDVSTTVLIAAYVPLLASFAVLLVVPEDGAARVITFIATVVCSDVGGYLAGVLFGKHPMARSVSPKKTWEGFAGSVLLSMIAGAVFFVVFFDAVWWQGAAYGLAIAAAATLGDLGESMLKRDLGVKDMGSLLPGHGGLMDRMDSLLPAAVVAWLLLSAFVPPVL